jgi:PLP dependent protein
MNKNSIKKNYQNLRKSIPEEVEIVAAAKTQTPERIREVIEAGARIIGENYVRETHKVIAQLSNAAEGVKWHMIGHLQRNKVKKAVEVFDMIETLDSYELAKEIDKSCRQIGKIMPVLIEINIAEEEQKTGVYPINAVDFARRVSSFPGIKILGIMTMGPRFGDPEEARPYFKKTKEIFDKIKKLKIANVEMKYLSMGMSNSYKVALEEGSNMIRPGSVIFGQREYE